MTRDFLNGDRLWFDRHPSAVVRFRRQHTDEFSTLIDQCQEAPLFLPSFSSGEKISLTWVAVVDVFQLLQDVNARNDGTRLRLRMRTIPLRRADQRALAKKELISAVAEELLHQALMDDAMSTVLNAA